MYHTSKHSFDFNTHGKFVFGGFLAREKSGRSIFGVQVECAPVPAVRVPAYPGTESDSVRVCFPSTTDENQTGLVYCSREEEKQPFVQASESGNSQETSFSDLKFLANGLKTSSAPAPADVLSSSWIETGLHRTRFSQGDGPTPVRVQAGSFLLVTRTMSHSPVHPERAHCLANEPIVHRDHHILIFGIKQGDGVTKFLACTKCGACLAYSICGGENDLGATSQGVWVNERNYTVHAVPDIIREIFDVDCCSTSSKNAEEVKCLKQLSCTFNLHTSRSALHASKNVGQSGRRSYMRFGVIHAYALSNVEEGYKGHVEMMEDNTSPEKTIKTRMESLNKPLRCVRANVRGLPRIQTKGIGGPPLFSLTGTGRLPEERVNKHFVRSIAGTFYHMKKRRLLPHSVLKDYQRQKSVSPATSPPSGVLQKGFGDAAASGLNPEEDQVFVYKKHCIKTFFMHKFGSQGDFLACINCGACLAHALYDLKKVENGPITEGVAVTETLEHLYGKDVVREFFDCECGGDLPAKANDILPTWDPEDVQVYSYKDFLQRFVDANSPQPPIPFLSYLQVLNLHTKAPVLRASKNVGQAARRCYGRNGKILSCRISEMKASYRTHIKKLPQASASGFLHAARKRSASGEEPEGTAFPAKAQMTDIIPPAGRYAGHFVGTRRHEEDPVPPLIQQQTSQRQYCEVAPLSTAGPLATLAGVACNVP
eukprot:gb/GECG01002173.1/.p1 GENE.gb/GECG01002173.1/~~gb/GECG01002173.1/.p1  ORF type:complete len:709 (+),score=55.37 gb/GECG01002173.1/:1-2127(+)